MKAQSSFACSNPEFKKAKPNPPSDTKGNKRIIGEKINNSKPMIMLPKQKLNHAISANTAQIQRITPQVNRYANLKWSIKVLT